MVGTFASLVYNPVLMHRLAAGAVFDILASGSFDYGRGRFSYVDRFCFTVRIDHHNDHRDASRRIPDRCFGRHNGSIEEGRGSIGVALRQRDWSCFPSSSVAMPHPFNVRYGARTLRFEGWTLRYGARFFIRPWLCSGSDEVHAAFARCRGGIGIEFFVWFCVALWA